MKVIIQGIVPRSKTWRGICIKCRSLMEETESALKVECDQKEDRYRFAHADCPVCKDKFTLYPMDEK